MYNFFYVCESLFLFQNTFLLDVHIHISIFERVIFIFLERVTFIYYDLEFSFFTGMVLENVFQFLNLLCNQSSLRLKFDLIKSQNTYSLICIN